MIRENYKDLVFACKCLASFLDTQVDITEYPEYGWVSIVFKTDNFGGCYTILHYGLKTGELHKDYRTDKELEIDSLRTLYRVVKEDLEKILKDRDFDYLNECINAEY